MSQIAGCPRCKKMYAKTDNSAVCPECEAPEFEDYNKVRDILEQHPDCNAGNAAELSEVTLECVLRMIDQDLIVNPDTVNPPKCGRCGKPAINLKKKICPDCLNKLSIEVYESIKKISGDSPGKQRIHGVHVTFDNKRR